MFHRLQQLFVDFPWLHYVAKIAALILAAWILRSFVLAGLRRWLRRTGMTFDLELIALCDRALVPVVSLAVIAASLNLFPLSAKFLAVANRVLYLSVLAVALYYGTKVAQLFLGQWLIRSQARQPLREPVEFLTRAIFLAFGTMLLLDNLGISLTAIWTTLGIGSLAVALALQDSLSNFFAGLYLRLDHPVRVGDYVKLDTEDKGVVSRLGWRSAWIRTVPDDNTVVVPNAKLASAIIMNYSLPDEQMSLPIRVNVSQDSDPEHVERVLVDEATRATREVRGLLAQPAPFVRFIPGFGDSSLDFTLICRISGFVDQYLVQHELRKRIFVRFREEGINSPVAQHEIQLHPTSLRALSASGSSPAG